MVSFRAKVLDALDIHKKSIKLQVNEIFPPVYKEDAQASDSGTISGRTDYYLRSAHVPYAVSKEIIKSDIGVNVVGGGTVKQTLDVLGFVIGNEVIDRAYKNMYPITMPSSDQATTTDSNGTVTNSVGESLAQDSNGNPIQTYDDLYTGFHSLGGLYDINSSELASMRKSAVTPVALDSMHPSGGLTEHAHTDWPDNTLDQMRLLTEFPYADSLFYHSTRMSFLLTGITTPTSSEKASNHRGVVRMLIVRPRIPTVRTRWSGLNGQPVLNMAYPPHFDTDLFYTKTKTLGGRMDNSIVNRGSSTNSGRKSHLSPTFGLKKYGDVDPVINQVFSPPTNDGSGGVSNNVPDTQLHYGHPIPSDGTDHTLSSYDVLTAPVNREKYAVVVDKMVTLDSLHHGVASKRIENVVIPYNKKIKFSGRKSTTTDDYSSDPISKQLSTDVHIEPLNFQSRPIIMFLSMDQKISAQVTGYTTITEC